MAQTGDFGGAGNRTQVFDGSVWKTYSPDAVNQYTTADGVGVTNGPEHQITTFDGITSTYFNDGQLSSVYSPSADTWTNFYYDALGRCVKRVKDNWAYTYSYYDGEKELLECGSGGGANYRNVYGKGIDEILVRKDNINNWTYYFQQDQNGNVTHLTWGDGTVVETFQYDAFGLLNKTESGWKNPFLFTGRRYQPTFGIYEYRARAYHPRLGRFTSEDPKLYDAGDYNLFRYCHNDPVDLTDPMGLSPFEPSGPERYIVTGSHIPVSPDKLLAVKEGLGQSTAFGRAAESLATVHFDKAVTVIVRNVDVLTTRDNKPYTNPDSYGGTDSKVSPGDPDYSGPNSTSVHLTLKSQLKNTKDEAIAERARRIECRNRNELGDHFFNTVKSAAQLRAAKDGLGGIHQFVQDQMDRFNRGMKADDTMGKNNPRLSQSPCTDCYGQ